MKSFKYFLVLSIIVTSLFQTSVLASESTETLTTVTFTEDTSTFVNPERGWYKPYKSTDIFGFDLLKSKGISTILLEVNLQDFLTAPISDTKLKEVDDAFTEARKYGIQVMFRAAYDYTGKENPEPKSLDIILGHIAQFKKIFFENEDVLYCVQAGFLGPWGEWHSSLYGNPPTLESRKAVLFALMNAVPKSRSIQVRRPMFIRDIFQNEPSGNIITEETAFNGSNLSRTGYHDDSLLSTANEYGTYVEKGYDRQAELNWVNNQNKYVPFGGETCYLGPNSDPENAIPELNKLHAQMINISYHPDVISKWKSTQYNNSNTFNFITSRLGYRFILTQASISSEIKKGGQIHLDFSIKNTGFGNLINQRNLELVLSNGTKSYSTIINEDPRKWYRENGVMSVHTDISIPSTIASGKWNLYLNLPNFSTSIHKNPKFSVRLANDNVWDETTGMNMIFKDLQIINTETNPVSTTFDEVITETPTSAPTASASATPTPSPTLIPFLVKGLKITNDSTSVIMNVNGEGLNVKSQFFINSDNNTSTGLKTKWRTSGFDYLIENHVLYSYSGTNNKWKWTRIQKIDITKTDESIQLNLPIKLIKMNVKNVLRIGFISNDDRSLTMPLLNLNPRSYVLTS